MNRLQRIQERKQAHQYTQPAMDETGKLQPPAPAQEPDTPNFTSLAKPYQPHGKITYAESGILPTMASSQAYRNDALASMNESQFDNLKERMNASDKEYWRAQVEKNPDSIYSNTALMLASDETPDEKKKRERREQLGQIIANVGNLIGNAANLYYTAQGAEPINLNSSMQKDNERMERIRAKRQAAQEQADAILRNAKLADLQGARELAAQRAKAQAENNRFMLNLALKQQEAAAKARQQESDNSRKDKELQAKLDNWKAQNAERARHNRAIESTYESGLSSSSSSRSRRGRNAGVNYPVMRLRSNNGQLSNERYDLNNDEDVLRMYGQGVKLGIFPDVLHGNDDYGLGIGNETDLSKLNVDDLRNYIIYMTGNYQKVNDQNEARNVFDSSPAQDNMPPSMRTKKMNDNVPPSMRK